MKVDLIVFNHTRYWYERFKNPNWSENIKWKYVLKKKKWNLLKNLSNVLLFFKIWLPQVCCISVGQEPPVFHLLTLQLASEHPARTLQIPWAICLGWLCNIVICLLLEDRFISFALRWPILPPDVYIGYQAARPKMTECVLLWAMFYYNARLEC